MSIDLKPWPEHPAPPGSKVDCAFFRLEGHGRLVWGEGNPAAPLMLILDNPGAREDPSGAPYVCGTRRTLRAAVREADLHQKQLYVTFLVKCRPRKAYDKSFARSAGLQVLADQIKTHRPQARMLFGDVVTRAVVGREDASVRELRGAVHTFFERPAVVTYHPLA